MDKLKLTAWVVAMAFIIWELHPLLSIKAVAGWDLVPHYYLVERMISILKTGHITAFDTNWYGGFPEFTFYGPLLYILVAVFQIITFSIIPLQLTYNLLLFGMPIAFIWAVAFTGRTWFGEKIAPYLIPFALIFLGHGRINSVSELGFNGEIYVGLISSFFAAILLIFLLGAIGKLLKKDDEKWIYISIALFASIILSHAITAIFACAVFVMLFLSYPKKLWKKLLIVFGGGIFISLPWVIPFITNLSFTSGHEMSLLRATTDPLFALFPKVDLIMKDPSIFILPGILLLISTVIGVLTLIKSKNHFWPLVVIFTLIVLPRDYLFQTFDLPIHYFRFITLVAVLNIFVAGAGLLYIAQKIEKLLPGNRFVVKILFFYIVALSIFLLTLSGYKGSEKTVRYLQEYSQNTAANEIIEYIESLNPEGRVGVENSNTFLRLLGSPHYFTSYLGEKNIQVLPGFLAESSINSEFTTPLFKILSESLYVGSTKLTDGGELEKDSKASHIRRLALYNTKYLLVSNINADKILSEVGGYLISKKHQVGEFTLLEIYGVSPKLQESTYKPFLFIDEGGLSFREFARKWYKDVDLFEYPVIYTKKAIRDIPESELENIGGFIVSKPNNSVLKEEEYFKLLDEGKETIILNSLPALSGRLINDKMTFIEQFDEFGGFGEVKKLIMKGSPQWTPITHFDLQNEEMAFRSNKGTLINYSYFPRWKSSFKNQTVYWATPTMMFVFGQGENELYYD